MELVTTDRIDFLRSLAGEFGHNYPRGRIVIAVDGPRGAGTRQFADGLAEVFRENGREAARASMEDFHAARSARARQGEDSPRGYYEDSYDYSTFRRVLIDPFRLGGSTGFQTKAFDLHRNAPVIASWLTGPADLVLIVDGVFLNRPEISGIWNASVYLDVDDATRYARLAASEGLDADPAAAANARYVGGQRLYQEQVAPQSAASAVVDNTDPEHPLRIFPDAGCCA